VSHAQVTTLVTLTPDFQPLQTIPYDPPVLPLFCKANNLYFLGDVSLDSGNGNDVAFVFGGQAMTASEVTLPAP
jgi:hypothetical protein